MKKIYKFKALNNVRVDIFPTNQEPSHTRNRGQFHYEMKKIKERLSNGKE